MGDHRVWPRADDRREARVVGSLPEHLVFHGSLEFELFCPRFAHRHRVPDPVPRHPDCAPDQVQFRRRLALTQSRDERPGIPYPERGVLLTEPLPRLLIKEERLVVEPVIDEPRIKRGEIE